MNTHTQNPITTNTPIFLKLYHGRLLVSPFWHKDPHRNCQRRLFLHIGREGEKKEKKGRILEESKYYLLGVRNKILIFWYSFESQDTTKDSYAL